MLAKLSMPRYGRVWYRRRQLSRLREFFTDATTDQAKVLWITGQAGSGKTALAASYLESWEQPFIWYQLDRGDTDPSSFFHYLGLALQRLQPDMPHMPLYAADSPLGLELFTRRYFRQLAEALPDAALLVLDNYQELPQSAPIHRLLCLAVDELAPRHKLLVMSRQEPPAEFSRLQAYGELRLMGQGSLNLAADEVIPFAERVCGHTLTESRARQLHQRTRGWVTGLLLLLRQDDEEPSATLNSDKDLLHRYFSAEVFSRMSEVTRAAAMSMALVPRFHVLEIPGQRDETCGNPIAEELFANPFVHRFGNDQDICEFHPLFRAFLVAEAKEYWGEAGYRERCLTVGLRHGELGMVEEAIAALTESGAQVQLAELIIRQSPQWFVQGRYQTLRDRMSTLTPATIRSRPWLSYWQAMATLPQDALSARQLYEQAYQRFSADGHREAALMAWAGIVQSYHFHWGSFSGLDRWIDELNQVLGNHYDRLDLSIRLQVTNGIYCSLLYRRMTHPDTELWRGRALLLLEQCQGVNERLELGQKLLMHSLWSGKLYSAVSLVERLSPLVREASPITAVYWWAFEANFHWLNADFESCLAVVQQGLAIIEERGLNPGHEFFLLSHAVYALLTQEKVTEAKNHLKRLAALVPPGSALHNGHCDYLMAYLHYVEGDRSAARTLLLSALEHARASGTIMPISLVETALATLYLEMNDIARATRHLRSASAIAAALDSEVLEFKLGVLQALIADQQGHKRKLPGSLRRAFSAAASGCLYNVDWCRSEHLARLCALALREGIETESVQRLIRRRKLLPQQPFQTVVDWPWPVRIFTMGQFAIVIDGQPLAFRGKSQVKVLDLLKVLVASGGRDVSECHLLDTLWPDAEGHMAQQNLKATVYRARKLLGVEAILWQSAALSLNPQSCWLDTWALEAKLDVLSGTEGLELPAQLAALAAAMALYRGGFLDGEGRGYALVPRERLRSRFLRSLISVAGNAVAENHFSEAIDLYQKALDIEPLAEQLYRELITVYVQLNQRAEALAVYQRCSEHLRSQLQLEPSEETSRLVEFDG